MLDAIFWVEDDVHRVMVEGEDEPSVERDAQLAPGRIGASD